MKEIAKLAYDHESHVRGCVLCEANAKELRRLQELLSRAEHPVECYAACCDPRF